MATVRVLVRLVDGGAADFVYGPEFLDRLAQLEHEGIRGKELIDALIGDDWGPPPTDARIVGTDAQGRKVDRVIYYD